MMNTDSMNQIRKPKRLRDDPPETLTDHVYLDMEKAFADASPAFGRKASWSRYIRHRSRQIYMYRVKRGLTVAEVARAIDRPGFDVAEASEIMRYGHNHQRPLVWTLTSVLSMERGDLNQWLGRNESIRLNKLPVHNIINLYRNIYEQRGLFHPYDAAYMLTCIYGALRNEYVTNKGIEYLLNLYLFSDMSRHDLTVHTFAGEHELDDFMFGAETRWTADLTQMLKDLWEKKRRVHHRAEMFGDAEVYRELVSRKHKPVRLINPNTDVELYMVKYLTDTRLVTYAYRDGETIRMGDVYPSFLHQLGFEYDFADDVQDTVVEDVINAADSKNWATIRGFPIR